MSYPLGYRAKVIGKWFGGGTGTKTARTKTGGSLPWGKTYFLLIFPLYYFLLFQERYNLQSGPWSIEEGSEIMMDDFLSWVDLGRICYDSFTLENWIPKLLRMTRKFFSNLYDTKSWRILSVWNDEELERKQYGGFTWAVSWKPKSILYEYS